MQAVAEPPIRVGDIETRITISAGFISLPFSGIPEEKFDWEKALNLADGALYLAKKNGRNRAYGLTKLLVPYEQAKTALESDLAVAIENKAVDYIEVIGPSAHKAD